jgi:hypothetical protein
MAKQTLVEKLRLQEGMNACIYNSPEGYLASLGQIPDYVCISDQIEGNFDFVHIFFRNRAELDKCIDKAVQAVKYDGILWISYPKGSSKVESDLSRDTLWEALSVHGIRPVSLISIDDVWSAMRFRPVAKVKGN